MATVLEKQAKRWTYEEYYRLNDDQRYEIIDGNLLMAPAPDTWHQSWLNEINLLLHQFVKQRKLGRIFIAPTDVVLDSQNTVQPDIVFVATATLGIIDTRSLFGTPDLLIELVSPGNARRDRLDEEKLYANFGVKEYWIGNAADKTLEIWVLKGSRYELHCSAKEKGRMTSVVLTGLDFDLSEIA